MKHDCGKFLTRFGNSITLCQVWHGFWLREPRLILWFVAAKVAQDYAPQFAFEYILSFVVDQH